MQKRPRGCPLKAKPERRTFGGGDRDGQTAARSDRSEGPGGIIARIAAKVTTSRTANVGVYHSERR